MRAVLSDGYSLDKEFQHLPADHLHIPGLHMFGHNRFLKAVEKLDEHYHPGCMEITVMVKGNQKFVVAGQEYSVSGGDVFITFQDEGHSTGENFIGGIESYWFQLDMREKQGFLGLHAPCDEWFYQRIASWKSRVLKVKASEITLLRSAFNCFVETGTEKTEVWLRGYALFLAFLTGMLNSDVQLLPMTADIRSAMEYIRERLPAEIDMEELAEFCGYSVSYLQKKFRRQVGMTPREYINRQKIDMAKTMLENLKLSVTEISYQLCFGSSNYFSTVFRQFTGYTPTQYRERLIQ